jgi:hypothetical protein
MTSSEIQVLIWGVIGIIGMLIFSLSFSHRIGKGIKDWKFAFGILLTGIAIYCIGSVNQNFASGLTLLGTVGAVFMALMSIQQTAKLENNHAKESLLKEIMDWAVEIQNAPVKNPIGPELLNFQNPNTVLDANELLLYGTIMTRNDYIKKISENAFEGKLKGDVGKLIENMIIYAYLKYKNLGASNPEKMFGGNYKELVLSFEQSLKNEGKTTEQLLREYGYKLPQSANSLVMKIGEVRATISYF